MKGFGIHVKNDLIEKKHIERMGVSVWLYMLLLDKVTKIDKDIGFVLGGKPIIESEITEEMGISPATYYRWVATLRKHEYISTTRTPRGLVFRIYKAVKPSIKNDKSRIVTSDKSDSTKVITRPITSDKSNKTVTVDSNSKTLSKDKGEAPQKGDPSVNKIMEAFKVMGYKPTNVKQQRRYAKNLVSREGVEEVINVLRVYYVARGEQYCPTITNPKQLYYKWDDLRQFIVKHKTKKSKVAKV